MNAFLASLDAYPVTWGEIIVALFVFALWIAERNIRRD